MRTEEYVKIFYIFHIFISVVISLISSQYLDKRFPKSKKSNFIFMLFFNISLPVIGYLFSFWIAYYLKTVKYEEVLENIHMINLEEFESSFVKIERAFGEGSMLELMRNDYAPTSLKIKALVSMSDNISQKNIAIIKDTLSSNNDEVRLFSFAIIDKIERGINSKIYKNLEKFTVEKNSIEKAKLAKELALLYWEMIYYELSEDSLKEYLLDEVIKYIEIANQADKYELKLHVVLGRVYMMRKEYERAATEFSFLYEMNKYEYAYIMPFLAEINFNIGSYTVVKSIITESRGLKLNSTLHSIVEQWKVS
ncbi:hypothetical protein KKG72_10190 [bacterium]|nr:hypothetical protein [bacterium]MBU1995212.1 hypothetical protein [bacterium]